LRIFVVWEPILASDFTAPNTLVLRRIGDPRARHYWDKEHVLAKRIGRDARPPQSETRCCRQEEILWDIAAVYPKGARWDATMPPAIVFDGPVLYVTDEINRALRDVAQ
jgi:hypothetical protein